MNSPTNLQGRSQVVNINGVKREIFASQRIIAWTNSLSSTHPGIYAGLIDLSDFGIAEGGSVNSIQVLQTSQNTSANHNAWRAKRKSASARYGHYSDTYLTGIGRINPNEVNIGNRVWLDSNKNGLQDDDETGGIENITVELRSLNFALLQSTVTDENGEYNFKAVPGSYMICISVKTLPANYRVTKLNAGNNDLVDSDFTGQFYCLRRPVAITSDNFSIDLGLYEIDTGPIIAARRSGNRYIGNRVFFDANRDGIHQIRKERGLQGIKVELYNDSDELVKTAVSGRQGYYHFRSIPAGKFYLKYDLNSLPKGYEITKNNPGRPAASTGSDNDANAEGFTGLIDLTRARSTRRVDLGLRKIIK